MAADLKPEPVIGVLSETEVAKHRAFFADRYDGIEYCRLADSHETLRKAAQELLDAVDTCPVVAGPGETYVDVAPRLAENIAQRKAAAESLRALLAGDQPKEGGGDG